MRTRWPAGLALALVAAALGSAAAEAPHSREFEITYDVRVGELPQGAHRVEVWLPVPAADANQEVTVEEVSTPFPYAVGKEPRFGNSILHLAAADPGRNELAVEMRVRVRRREYLRHDFRPAAATTGADGAAAPAPTSAATSSARSTRTACSSRSAGTSCSRRGRRARRSTTSSTRTSRWMASRSPR